MLLTPSTPPTFAQVSPRRLTYFDASRGLRNATTTAELKAEMAQLLDVQGFDTSEVLKSFDLAAWLEERLTAH